MDLTRTQFDMMEGEAMVREMVCVYNKNTKEFHTIVRVGRDVCGYPRTVHGGLTAAIADETFGGALTCSPCKSLRSSSVDSMRAAHSKTSIAYDACSCACLSPPSSSPGSCLPDFAFLAMRFVARQAAHTLQGCMCPCGQVASWESSLQASLRGSKWTI